MKKNLLCALVACALVIGFSISAAHCAPILETRTADQPAAIKWINPHWLYTPGGWFWFMWPR